MNQLEIRHLELRATTHQELQRVAALTLQSRPLVDAPAPPEASRVSDMLRNSSTSAAAPVQMPMTASAVMPTQKSLRTRTKLDDQLDLLKLLVEMFTGKKMHGAKTRGVHAEQAGLAKSAGVAAPSRGASGESAAADAVDAEFAMREDYTASEHVTVQADGVLHTADGHDVKFTFSIEVEHELAIHRELHAQSNGGGDPIRVDYAGSVDDLQSIHFALQFEGSGDADGSAAAPTNGSLTFDRSTHAKQSKAGTLYRAPDQRPLSSITQLMQSLRDWERVGDGLLRDLLAAPSGGEALTHAVQNSPEQLLALMSGINN